jgi:CMP-N-acetylneuraminic acid synthetase
MSKIGESIWMGDFMTPGDIELYPMDEREVFDIDYEWQFKYYENLYKSGVR